MNLMTPFKIVLIVQLFGFSTFAKSANPSAISGLNSPQVQRQVMVDQVLDVLFTKLRNISWVEDLDREFSKGGTSVFRAQFKRAWKEGRQGKVPRLERLNRGIAFTVDGVRHTIVLENLVTQRYIIDGKYAWNYTTKIPLESQLRELEKQIKTHVSWLDFLLPRAEAIEPMTVMTFLAGFLISVAVAPIVTDIVNKYFYPQGKAGYCEGRERKDSFETSSYCDEYFKWREQYATAKIPTVNPASESKATGEKLKVETVCPTKENTDFLLTSESLDQKVKFVRRVQFESGKPVKIIERALAPINGLEVTYNLNSLGSVESRDGFDGFKSRKADHLKGKSQEEVAAITKEFDAAEEMVKDLADRIKKCEPEEQKTLVKKAGEPGSALLTSSVVPAEDVATPSSGVVTE